MDVSISFENLKFIYERLNDADHLVRVFYPDANWAERKGMKLLMDDLDAAEEKCLEIMRPVYAAQDALRREEEAAELKEAELKEAEE